MSPEVDGIIDGGSHRPARVWSEKQAADVLVVVRPRLILAATPIPIGLIEPQLVLDNRSADADSVVPNLVHAGQRGDAFRLERGRQVVPLEVAVRVVVEAVEAEFVASVL